MLNNPELLQLLAQEHQAELIAQARSEALARLAPPSSGRLSRVLAGLRLRPRLDGARLGVLVRPSPSSGSS